MADYVSAALRSYTILTYHQAVDRARQLARGSEGDDGGPLATVTEAGALSFVRQLMLCW